MSSLSRAPGALTVNLALGLVCLIWGSTWIVIQEGLHDLPPFTSAGVRFVLAAVLMAAVVPFLRRREGGGSPPVRLWVAMGVLNVFVPYGLVYWSETILPSGIVSVLWAVFPILVATLGHRFLPGERLASGQWLGFLLGFFGVALLFWTDLVELGPDAPMAGALLLLSPLVAAFGTLIVKRHGGSTSSILLNRNGFALGAVLLLALAAGTEQSAEVSWTTRAFLSVGYLAVFGTVVTFGLYFWLMRFAPAHRLSLISYVIPAIALGLGWGFGQETITAWTLAGTGLIVCGVALVLRTQRAPA